MASDITQRMLREAASEMTGTEAECVKMRGLILDSLASLDKDKADIETKQYELAALRIANVFLCDSTLTTTVKLQASQLAKQAKQCAELRVALAGQLRVLEASATYRRAVRSALAAVAAKRAAAARRATAAAIVQEARQAAAAKRAEVAQRMAAAKRAAASERSAVELAAAVPSEAGCASTERAAADPAMAAEQCAGELDPVLAEEPAAAEVAAVEQPEAGAPSAEEAEVLPAKLPQTDKTLASHYAGGAKLRIDNVGSRSVRRLGVHVQQKRVSTPRHDHTRRRALCGVVLLVTRAIPGGSGPGPPRERTTLRSPH